MNHCAKVCRSSSNGKKNLPSVSSLTLMILTLTSHPGADRYVLFCGPMFVPAFALSQPDFMVK